MFGAIIGDIVGSPYERRSRNIKTTDFPLFNKRGRFTDDSILTAATADAILHGRSFVEAYKDWGRRYLDHPFFGRFFMQWLRSDSMEPYGAWSNGCAMRVSPIGWACGTLEETLEMAQESAACTHNHPNGIKGAQATAATIWLGRNGKPKDEIRDYITTKFGYRLNETLDEIRPNYQWDVSCEGTLPVSLLSFLESEDFESALRLAVSVGGDSDTIACIAGSMADAFYRNIPQDIQDFMREKLSEDILNILTEFEAKYVSRKSPSSTDFSENE